MITLDIPLYFLHYIVKMKAFQHNMLWLYSTYIFDKIRPGYYGIKKYHIGFSKLRDTFIVSTALFFKLKTRTAKDSVKDTETYPQHSEQIMNLPVILVINPALTVYFMHSTKCKSTHLTHLLVILHILNTIFCLNL